MTAEEVLALPDDGVHRALIRGELREWPMTYRNRTHARLEARLAKLLGNWLDTQPEPRGEVVSGEAGFRLSRGPDSLVGVDVAYVSPEVALKPSPTTSLFEGAPVLAVEILSPSDTQGDVATKVGLYLEFGSVVWVVDPDFQTITLHRPSQLPETLNTQQELSGEPYLPGFRTQVAAVFEG
jgi:Uma2 family endonuclease